MTAQWLILVGGGGHALVVSEAARSTGCLIRGFLDDDRTATVAELPWLGETATSIPGTVRHCAIGDLKARRSILARMACEATVVHRDATVSPTASIGADVLIGARAVVQGRATIASHAIINTGAIVEHDCTVGENAHIAPGAVLGGDVHIGADTLIGLGARVRPPVPIGAGVTVGVGAVVVEDVPDGMTVVGVPARAHLRVTGSMPADPDADGVRRLAQ